jgi:hypothetical protein
MVVLGCIVCSIVIRIPEPDRAGDKRPNGQRSAAGEKECILIRLVEPSPYFNHQKGDDLAGQLERVVGR